MMYLFSTKGYADENELIRKLCSWQGDHIHVASLDDMNMVPYFKKYFKGNGPAIVISRDFLDVTTSPVTIVYGFWNFVNYYQSHRMVRI